MAIYCIGDVHGRLDLLKILHKKIMDDASQLDGNHKIIFLGDYIDRGDDSKGVIDFLISKPFKGFEHIFLKGNHEDMMLGTLTFPRTYVQSFIWNGGIQTALSYGSTIDDVINYNEWAKNVGKRHIKWLENLKIYHIEPEYLFVHAGIRPGVPLNEQKEEELIWIRDLFLKDERNHGFIVVHGHTPVNVREVKHNRINIDTGAFLTGVLTCLVIDNKFHRFIDTHP